MEFHITNFAFGMVSNHFEVYTLNEYLAYTDSILADSLNIIFSKIVDINFSILKDVNHIYFKSSTIIFTEALKVFIFIDWG